jgi:hypothetical protein
MQTQQVEKAERKKSNQVEQIAKQVWSVIIFPYIKLSDNPGFGIVAHNSFIL